VSLDRYKSRSFVKSEAMFKVFEIYKIVGDMKTLKDNIKCRKYTHLHFKDNSCGSVERIWGWICCKISSWNQDHESNWKR
jgi:hypothetical protein